MLTNLKSFAAKVLEFFFSSKPAFLLLLILLAAPVFMLSTIVQNSHPGSFTVMVTQPDEQSGGSGSVVFTSPNKSIVLTNAHVCDVLNESGGLVKKEDGAKYMVTAYRKSEFHDLCAVWVAADLGHAVKLAKKAPAVYSEATITGHPALLPNVINKGAFGERKFIDVLVGTKKCTKENVRTAEDMLYCMFLGAIPVIKTYESITVSATIMGGSSGSAVLNDAGELAGVVFAGQGKGLSYAFIVPFEYVSLFLTEELNTPAILTKVPLEKTQTEDTSSDVASMKRKIITQCRKDSSKVQRMCAIFKQDIENNQ